MKKITFIFLLINFVFISCDKDEEVVSAPAVSDQVVNLAAPQTGGQGQPIGGPFTKFDFATGSETTSETDWDIAFRGTTIAVNGGVATGTADEPTRNGTVGAAISTGTFAGIVSAEGLTFDQDSTDGFAIPTGSGNGWYNYNPQAFTISPIPGRIIVIQTRNGNYAKMEILSYYQNQPENPDPFTDLSRYYSFNYLYNPNVGEFSLE